MTEDTIKRIGEIQTKVDGKKLDEKLEKVRETTTQEHVKNIRRLHEQGEMPSQEGGEKEEVAPDQETGENRAEWGENRKTNKDQPREEAQFRKNFEDLNVIIEFLPLEVYENRVFWGGTIDGIVQFVYKITPDETTSGVVLNYPKDSGFSVDDPDNMEITERIESYYNQFYKYWRDNLFQTEA